MGKKLRDLDDCQSGDDFLRWAERKGANVRHGKHTVVYNDKGTCALPCHRKELPRGTRGSIIKLFLMMGLAVMAYLIFIPL